MSCYKHSSPATRSTTPRLNADDSLNRPEAGTTHDDSINQAPLTARSEIFSTANATQSRNIEITQEHERSPGTGN